MNPNQYNECPLMVSNPFMDIASMIFFAPQLEQHSTLDTCETQSQTTDNDSVASFTEHSDDDDTFDNQEMSGPKQQQRRRKKRASGRRRRQRWCCMGYSNAQRSHMEKRRQSQLDM